MIVGVSIPGDVSAALLSFRADDATLGGLQGSSTPRGGAKGMEKSPLFLQPLEIIKVRNSAEVRSIETRR
jgi:hypothetical protein